MNVTINRPFLPVTDEACFIYSQLIYYLYHSDNIKEFYDFFFSKYMLKHEESMIKYFLFECTEETIHIYQRKLSDNNEIFPIELFTLS